MYLVRVYSTTAQMQLMVGYIYVRTFVKFTETNTVAI